MTASDDLLAPVDYLVLQLPAASAVAADLDALLRLADDGVIGVLDAEFVVNDGGNCRILTTADASALLGVDASAWDGASAGLLQSDDLEGLADELDAGSVALVLVYENLWIHSVVGPWSEHGVRVVAEGVVHPEELIAALDAGDDA
ncbi:DUF6325 family protein [Desertimonas flava]|uniref:DUF6325 family protein n=1 Tax=Desertimonas flava TaxID=2064846 RepID=UPI000E35432A|nr:DUF6325 family protein [Desertimonas flava]